jgi:protein gp37
MADLFGNWVPDAWVNTVFAEISRSPRHTYIFLTKDPNRASHRIIDYFYSFGEKFFPSHIPQNWWIGTSVEGSRYTGRIDDLRKIPTENRFVSFEPLLGSTTSEDFPLDLTGIKQVIIGAQSNPTVTPVLEDILTVQKEAARVGAKIFCKDSLSYLNIGELNNYFLRDLCWQVHK